MKSRFKIILLTPKLLFYFALIFSVNAVYSQSNTLPPNGNVGIGTVSPTSRLQVNGNAVIDSSLMVRDSLTIQKGARIKSTLKVDGDVIFKSNLLIKTDLKVVGNSNFKGDVVLKEGSLKLKSIRDTTTNEKGLLMIKNNGEVVNGGVLQDIMYSEMIYELACIQDELGNIHYRKPFWEANTDNGMFLLQKNCMKEVRLGVGIKPTAKFHVLSPKITTTLPLLIERSSGNQSPSYKLMQLDNNGLLYAREVKVNLDVWPDYVFGENYPLMPLEELQKFIKTNNHLPNVPNATEMKEQGINVAKTNVMLMEKIEELTLYMLQINNQLIEQKELLKQQNETILLQQQLILQLNENAKP